MSQEAKQCEACTRYQPVAKQFQVQCLSLSKLQHHQPLIAAAPNGDKSENEKPSENVAEEVIKQVILYFRAMVTIETQYKLFYFLTLSGQIYSHPQRSNRDKVY